MSTEGVRRWLSEFKTLTEAEWTTYAFGIRQDEGLEQELQDAFEGDLSAEAIDPICHQLFDFYRSMNVELQRFTLNLLPTLITSYLTSLTSKDKRFGGIEACLLGIYNLSVIGADGKPKVSDVTIPTLACSSIYHEPPSLASLVLTESALLRHHSDRPAVITVGPLAPIHCMNSQNRLPVLTHVISRYNANITCMSTSSHQMLGKMCSRLAKTGFEGLRELSSYSSSGEREVQVKRGVSFAEELRIPLNSDFLLELLTSLYYIMFKNDPKCAITALEDIHTRASYDLLPEVLLVTNAIRNSIRVGGSADDLVGRTMGISVAVSPSRANPIFSKDAITNASFKARKLPEDIRRAALRDALAEPAQLLASSAVTQNLLDKLDIKVPAAEKHGSSVNVAVRKQVRELHEEYNIQQSLDKANSERAKALEKVRSLEQVKSLEKVKSSEEVKSIRRSLDEERKET